MNDDAPSKKTPAPKWMLVIADQPTLRESLFVLLRYHAMLNGSLSLMIEESAGVVIIREDCIGIVNKKFVLVGSHKTLPDGQIIALNGEAGYQADLLRGGLHFGLWRWQYRVHKVPLVTIPQGKVGYVYARDGQALPPSQTLGRVTACNNFQDARAFLIGDQSTAIFGLLVPPTRVP